MDWPDRSPSESKQSLCRKWSVVPTVKTTYWLCRSSRHSNTRSPTLHLMDDTDVTISLQHREREHQVIHQLLTPDNRDVTISLQSKERPSGYSSAAYTWRLAALREIPRLFISCLHLLTGNHHFIAEKKETIRLFISRLHLMMGRSLFHCSRFRSLG